MSKGEREITSKLNHFDRGREFFNREKEESHQRPQMLGVQGEKSHVFKRGKTCSYLVVCICSDFLCSDFLFPIFSQYPMQDSGGARHLREGNP
jgi:hypothetical protein